MKYSLTIAMLAWMSGAVMIASPGIVAAQEVPPTDDPISTASGPSVSTSVSTAGSSAPSTGSSISTAGPAVSSVSSVSASPVTAGGSISSVSSGGSFVGSSNGGGSGASGLGVVTGTSVGASPVAASCPLISSTILNTGIANDPADVTRLQTFLQNDEHIDVAVTGTYDAQTVAAVKAFQLKYASDILAPWGATQASGAAYITTLKKVNQLACAEPLTMTPAELAVIAAYKADAAAGQNAVGANGAATAGLGSTTPLAPVVGQLGDQNANVAGVGGAPILSRFWSFLKGIF